MLQGKVQAAGAEHYTGMVDAFRKIIASEGAGRLYRGIVPPLMLEAPKRAVKFSANDFWGKTYRGLAGTEKMTQGLSILTGCSAGGVEACLTAPFELVKIKLQDKAQAHLYKGPIDVIKQVLARDGLVGMFSGLESTFWRHVLWNGGYFGSIFQVRSLLPKPEGKGQELRNNFISGAIGGFIGTALNTPADVFKSRVQNATWAPGQKKPWTFQGIATIAREEGFKGMYKGFTPKVLRLAPGGGVLLLVVEVVLEQFRHVLGPPYI